MYRTVRAVHGQGSNGYVEIWLYIPEHNSDKSQEKRRGWWLYPEPGKKGLFYISELSDVQRNNKKDQVKDVATFSDFPFDRTVECNDGAEIMKTLRCVTSRTLTKVEMLSMLSMFFFFFFLPWPSSSLQMLSMLSLFFFFFFFHAT